MIRKIVHKGTEYEMLYDAEDHEFISKLTNLNISQNKNGYMSVSFGNYILSRFLMKVTDSDTIVDHIDRNPLNNQKANLRLIPKKSGLNQFNVPYDPKEYRRGIVDEPQNQQFRVYIRAKNVKVPIRCFNNNHDAIRYAYPFVQQIQGEYCSDKRSLEQVLQDVPYKQYDRVVASKVEGTLCPTCNELIHSHYHEHVSKCIGLICVCGAEFEVRGKLLRHMKENCPLEEKLQYFCDICNKSFVQKDSVRRHKREKHPESL